MKKSIVTCLVAASLMPMAAWAAGDTTTPQKTIQMTMEGEARMTVPNDEAIVVLSAQRQEKDVNAATDDVVRCGDAVMKALKALGPNVVVETTGLSTQPVYTRAKEGEVSEVGAWQARQTLRVTVRDVQLVSKVLSAAGSDMTYDGIQFRVSDRAQDAQQDELIRRAVADAMRQAQVVTQSIGRKASELEVTNIRVGSVSDGGRRYYAAPMMAAESSGRRAVPQVSAGTAEMSLSVTLQAELPR